MRNLAREYNTIKIGALHTGPLSKNLIIYLKQLAVTQGLNNA
jgi:hypothetical protein